MQDELSRVREALGGAFAGDSGVLLAVLFGSAARGSLSRESDVDVGIIPADPEVSLAWELQLQGRLMTACGRSVDLVRLDCASTLVRWEVARIALLLFTASPSVFTNFVAEAALEHADIAPLMEKTAEVYRRRLAAGGGSLTDPVVVLRKLALLREHLARVRRRRPANSGTLASDVDILDALSMSLLVAVQETIDVAFHLCADEGWGVPASYAESFGILARQGVVSDDLARRLGGTATLRNRLAHGYASVDVERLWAELPDGLNALEDFASAVATWLGR